MDEKKRSLEMIEISDDEEPVPCKKIKTEPVEDDGDTINVTQLGRSTQSTSDETLVEGSGNTSNTTQIEQPTQSEPNEEPASKPEDEEVLKCSTPHCNETTPPAARSSVKARRKAKLMLKLDEIKVMQELMELDDEDDG